MLGKKVLLIDDDPDFLLLTGAIIRSAGAQVFAARNGMEGISKIYAHHPDLICLDVVMPGRNGFDVCRKIKQLVNTPLIIISALDEDHNELDGYEAGADYFLTKPVRSETLLLRAATILRRKNQAGMYDGAISYDDDHLKIDIRRRSVLIEGRRVKLTPVEFRLLTFLVNNSDRVLSIEQILANVWGIESSRNRDYVHVYISHLRSKIEEDAKLPRYIRSIHGVGYIFERQAYA